MALWPALRYSIADAEAFLFRGFSIIAIETNTKFTEDVDELN